jgi:phosphoadenosine phosphosulfate reductase
VILSRIGEHLAAHDGKVALAVGKDSLPVLHMALAVEPNLLVAFSDSGLESPRLYWTRSSG